METQDAVYPHLDQLFKAAALVSLEAPAGFVERVMTALSAESSRGLSGAWLARSYEWARRSAGRRRTALASSALVVGALAAGLEARHLRRARRLEAA